jgi:hypothetical protein
MERGGQTVRRLRQPSPRRRVAALLFATLATGLLAGSAAHAQQAIRAGDILTGRLRLVHTSHPNGSRIDAYQIVSAPRTMPSDDDFCEDGKGVTSSRCSARRLR